ncbi:MULTISPECIES: hypothetical protein [Pantoea]|uniref:Uncharacterized protein n=1 Tax=Pantoea anthophila TaxID=470931 RepID=A0ABY2ZDE7_9GAMM|nr:MULTISPECIES: hypothetical protein [Pantoea]KAA5974364.1 hypothetical protein F3I51_06425 [Pantoea sp. M_6]KAA5978373.1 hypothetical protein F3I52_08575 [Pantoea sp. M_8]KAA5989870.1 hypothetical protein F3I47_13495 [Pantoea sp. M_10]KAA6002899.1 hypothetical protein F3I50_01185 [Pantoea sp. M_5]TPV31060.1 hypothetical protein FJW00_04010 [Pantoea anthophila]
MKKVVKTLVIAITVLAVLAFAVMILLIVSIRPSKVDAAQAEACRHYDYQTIMTKVIRAKTGDQAEWKSFSDVQDAAQNNGILIDYGQMTFGNDIWLVPFTKRNGQSANGEYFGMLDCTTDSVEFSKK